MNRKELIILILVFSTALAVRTYFVPFQGFVGDIMAYKNWSQLAVEKGVHNMYDRASYPPVYMYVLKVVGSIYKIVSPAFDKDTVLLQFLMKFPSILADLIISAAIFIYVRKKSTFSAAMLAMSAFAFNPVIIMNSAWWGQVDSIPTLIAFGAILALVNNKFGLAWGLMALGLLTKVQTVAILPILVLITCKRCGIRGLFNSMSVAWGATIVLLSPFFYHHKMISMIKPFFGSVGEFPYISMNAFNFWWLFSGGKGMQILDSNLFLNMISYRSIGLIFLGLFYIIVLWDLSRKEKDEGAIFYSSFLAIFSFFMLATEMHERYIVMAFAFLIIGALKRKDLKILYVGLSLTTFFSLLFVLLFYYPNSIPTLTVNWRALPVGIIISVINAMFFIYILYFLIRDIKVKYLGYALTALIVLFLGAYYLKPSGPVYLSDLTPKSATQQWGKLGNDRSVDARSLIINGFIYQKGLGTHAYSSIKYTLDGKFRYLDGAVGLDDEAAMGNKIQAFIYADDKQIYDSGVFGGWVDPHYFKLNVSGVKVIKLVITDGGDGIDRDHGDWLGIRILP